MEGLTPLLDVLFVVLVLFILITPMISKEDVALTQGGKKTRPVAQNMLSSHPMKLTVTSKETILLNGQTLKASELLPSLKALHAKYPRTIPQLYHDKKASFGCFQTIKHSLEKAGFDRIDLIVQKGDLK